MTIGLMAIMLDEVGQVDRWRSVRASFDQILVVDGGSTDGTVEKLKEAQVPVLEKRFEGNFSEQRNAGLALMVTDWTLEVDADELLSTPLLVGLRTICSLADADGVDCIGLPRLNFIDGKLVPSPGHGGLDFQYRLHRTHCTWTGAVHEEITGFTNRVELNVDEGQFLLHRKSSERHERRNAYYRSLR